MRARALLRAASVLLLVAAVPSTSAEETLDVEVDLDASTSATVRVTRTWTGDDAADVRAALDRAFGDGDGNLSRAEIDAVEDATEQSMRGEAFPMLRARAFPSRVEAAKADLEQEGDTFRARHVVELALGNGTGADGTVTLLVAPLGNGTLRLLAPEGWIVRGAEGVERPAVQGRLLEGELDSGSEALVTLARAPDPFDEQAEPEEARADTPALGVAGAVLAVALAAARRRSS